MISDIRLHGRNAALDLLRQRTKDGSAFNQGTVTALTALPAGGGYPLQPRDGAQVAELTRYLPPSHTGWFGGGPSEKALPSRDLVGGLPDLTLRSVGARGCDSPGPPDHAAMA